MSKARLLIVEDEQIVVMDIQATLESYGYTIVGQTDNGADAILKAAELHPDLVMMDIGLKGEIDGIEAAIQIRAQLDLPVIFLTAFANQATLERARLAEPFGYILKPFNENELTIAIELALYKHGIEHKLRESENKFRNVIEHSSDGIVLVDSQEILIEWNPSMEEISGLRRASVIGQPVLEVIFQLLPEETKTPAGHEWARQQWNDVINTKYSPGLRTEMENEIETPQGVRKIVQSSAFAIETDKGRLAGATIKDITASKQAEQQLAANEARLSALITNTGDLIVVMNAQGIVTFASPASERTFGYSPAESMGRNFIEWVHPDDLAEILTAFQSRKETPATTPHSIHARGLHKDGSLRYVDVLVTNLLDDPAVGGLVVNVHDVTEQKRVELEKQVLYEIMQGMAYSKTLSEFLGLVHYSLNRVLRADNFFVSLYNPATGFFEDVYCVDQYDESFEQSNREGSLTSYIFRTGNPLLDTKEKFNELAALGEVKLVGVDSKSWIGVPLKAAGKTIGVMAIQDYETPNLYSEKDLAFLASISGQVASAVERKQAEERSHESEERYRSLFEDSPISLWEDDYSALKQKLDELKLEGVTDFETYFAEHPKTTAECMALVKILDANQYSVKLFNAENKQELLANAGRLLAAEVIDHLELVNIANGMTHFEWEGINRKLTGELMNIKLTWSVAPGREDDLSKVIISIIDITEQKQAEAAINRQLSELETLYESGLAISRLLTPKEIAQKVIEILNRRMNWHHIAIRQYRPETDMVKLIAFNRPGISAEEAEEHIVKMNEAMTNPSQGVSGWVTLHGKTARVPNVKNDDRYKNIYPEICSGLYVPLMIGEQATGSISVESEEENAFSINDERLLETLAGQAAIAIDNANLFELTKKEIMERLQAEAVLTLQAEELFQLNNTLEQRVRERTAEIEVTRTRLQLATDAARLGIWEWDILSGNLIWDTQMHQIYDIAPQDFDGKIDTLLKSIHPEDQNMLLNAARNLMEKKESSFKIEHRHLHKNGEIHTLFEQGVAVFDERGFLERIIGIVNDITLQKQAEQNLRESEAYARLLFDAAPDPVFVAEVDGVMVDVNRLFEQQHHINRGEVRGRHLSELNIFPPEQLEKANDYIMSIVEGKDIAPVELNFYHSGGLHTLEMHSYPIEVKGRKLVLSTSRDITLHKKAEELLRLSNIEMERALRVKGEFLANMSHELRTPLNAILGMAESLEEQIAGTLNDRQLKYVGTIWESGRHLLDLINDILDLSKIEAGRLELNVAPVSVSRLCEASLRMVKEQAQKKGQKISLNIDPEVKTIMGDERRLKQALVNLLINAVKFTPNDRQIGVEVKGKYRNQTVTFTVWDEGIGITAEELNLIFKPFVQLDAGLAREFSGTGLGLALVAQMIRLHGGSVSVESKEGGGSRFSITLPWVDMEETVSAKRVPQKTAAGSASEEKRSGKILIVEDTESIIMMLNDYLHYKGYQILIARNGMEGVALAIKERPDLILMDVMMPVMDGVDATKKIRAEKGFQEIPIIALTALVMPGDKERCLNAGMNEYLSKPIQMADLESVISNHFHKGQNAPPA